MAFDTIQEVRAIEVLDSRGNPTVGVMIGLDDGSQAWATVPSGASTGAHEAVELRDGGIRYGGKGVQTACRHVNEILGPTLVGRSVSDLRGIDRIIRDMDGSEQKSRLGANALLGVSLAAMRAAAVSQGIPLYRYIGGSAAATLPVPQLNVLNGGAHADNNVDIQEFMIVPVGASSFSEALRMASETYHALRSLLKDKHLRTAVGDEGGFAPDLSNDREALDLLVQAIEQVGLTAGKDMVLAIDVAANELWQDGRYRLGGSVLSSDQMIDFYQSLLNDYPVVSIEDGLAEDDWDGWSRLRKTLGDRVQLVGDDIFVTNPDRIQRGIQEQSANAVLIKLNQIGTVSETLEAIQKTQHAGWRAIISHRSGETEDSTIADLAVGTNAGQIKTGAPARSERVAKYNRLLVIESDDPTLHYAGWEAFRR